MSPETNQEVRGLETPLDTQGGHNWASLKASSLKTIPTSHHEEVRTSQPLSEERCAHRWDSSEQGALKPPLQTWLGVLTAWWWDCPPESQAPASRGRNNSGASSPVPATRADVSWHLNPYQHGGKLDNQKCRVSRGNVDFRGCPCSHQRFSVWESRQVNRGALWVSPWALNVFCASEVLGLVCKNSQLTEVTWGLLLQEQ